MVFEKLAKHHASQLLDFELENKQWFETLIEPRAKSFYSIKGVTEHIDLLINQMNEGTGYSGVLLQNNIIVARANIKDVSNNEAFVGYRVAEAFTSKGAASFCLSQLKNIAQNKFNRVVVWQNRGVTDVDLDLIAGKSKTISISDPLIKVAKALGIYIGEL